MTSDGAESANPPEGFKLGQRGPFTVHNGPIFRKETDDGLVQGFRVLDRHCNGVGILHGGMMMAFIDGVLGTAVWRETDRPALTIRMTCDFLSIARPGDWIEGLGTVTKATRSVAFVEGRVWTGEKTVLTASGVFKMMRKRNYD